MRVGITGNDTVSAAGLLIIDGHSHDVLLYCVCVSVLCVCVCCIVLCVCVCVYIYGAEMTMVDGI